MMICPYCQHETIDKVCSYCFKVIKDDDFNSVSPLIYQLEKALIIKDYQIVKQISLQILEYIWNLPSQ